MYRAIFFFAFACFSLAWPSSAQSDTESSTLPNSSHFRSWGFDLDAEDKNVSPGDNFFLFANGSYVKHLEIPPDRSSYGLLASMDGRSTEVAHGLIEAELAHPGATPAEQKAIALYRAYMDEARIEALGAAPLKVNLDRIRAVRSKQDLTRLMGASTKSFGSTILEPHIVPDSSDTTHYILELHQGGLGMPGRNYYLKPELRATREKYQAYIASMLTLVGWPDANHQAEGILSFETKIAKASWDDGELRDPRKNYHPMRVRDVAKSAPGFDLRAFLNAAGYADVDRINARESSAITGITAAFAETPLDTLKAWEAFHLVDQTSGLLPKRFVQTAFEFHGQVIDGQSTLEPRWKRAMEEEDERIGEAVGAIYVAHTFTPEAKAQLEQLVANLKSAFRSRLERATWMSDATKIEALKKLDTMSVGIGYPSKWKTYDFEITSTDLYGNVERSNAWSHQQAVLRLHRPVDREHWDLLPQSTASEYDPSINRITFPAANLQFPFFDPKADPAVNYGAIGVVIGHEITHGFDDQGRHTDSAGLLRDWWSADDADKFNVQANRLALQYSSFEPLPGIHVNGPNTLGEDLADTGGMAVSLDAYHLSLGDKPAPILDGTTGDQRFFLSCAQVWAGKATEKSLRRQLANNPHPPGEQRVNGEVRNLDAWYAAFDVKPGDKLYISPEDRVHIW